MTPLPLMERPAHRAWLMGQIERLVDFHRASAGGAAGFRALGLDGAPLHGSDEVFPLHETTRMVHVMALATQLGIPGLHGAIDQGMRFLWRSHRDPARGGYHWGASASGVADGDKRAYGHAFVLLAGASALRLGHPDAARLVADVTEVIEAHFWEEEFGAVSEEYRADWSEIAPYRGQNANMHMTEALMAAYEATGERGYLDKAVRIAHRIIDTAARALGWRVAEHFSATWEVDQDYDGDPMFRPGGITPGHALEWSRLLVQLWELDGKAQDWMVEAARGLFGEATAHGWDARRGGFVYTLGWDDAPLQPLRLWWPNAEAIGAAATLWKLDASTDALSWYGKVWEVVGRGFIDHRRGGWYPELDPADRPSEGIFAGKPDIYHAFQACLIPLLPKGLHLSGDMTRAL